MCDERQLRNIAKGQTTAKDVVNSWIQSEGHRPNILNRDLEQTGVRASQPEDGT